MISNSGTASNTSFFTTLPRWLQLVHFQSWTSSSPNQLSKQFPKLATPLSGTRTSIQAKTCFLIDWYLQILHCRIDETHPWYLGNRGTGRIVMENSCVSCCMLSANCGNSNLTAYLACTGCITISSVLCTNFSNVNTCSFKFLPSFLTSCFRLLLYDETASARHWKITFM